MEELSRLPTLPSAAAGTAIAEAASHEATHTDDAPTEIISAPELPHMEVSHYAHMVVSHCARMEMSQYDPRGGESLWPTWR